MVAGDDDLEGVRQGAQEVVELADVIQGPTASKVAGVDQNVAVGDLEGPVQSVGVCDSDEFQRKHHENSELNSGISWFKH